MKPTRYRMLADSHDGKHDIAKTNQVISRTVRESAVAFHMTQDPDNGQYPIEDLIQLSKQVIPLMQRSSTVTTQTFLPVKLAVSKTPSKRLQENRSWSLEP